jgi:hypothetical protein
MRARCFTGRRFAAFAVFEIISRRGALFTDGRSPLIPPDTVCARCQVARVAPSASSVSCVRHQFGAIACLAQERDRTPSVGIGAARARTGVSCAVRAEVTAGRDDNAAWHANGAPGRGAVAMHCLLGYQAHASCSPARPLPPPAPVWALERLRRSRPVSLSWLVARGFPAVVPGRFGVRDSFLRRMPGLGKALA